jgi:hypothetical protein
MILSTMEIENEVLKLFSNINQSLEEEYKIDSNSCIFFKKSNQDFPSGTYVYSNEQGYHIDAIGDRGGIVDEKLYNDLEEVFFRLCWDVISSISISYASKNRISGYDWRRIMFKKRLDILQTLGESFYQKGKIMIEEILKENPYDDELLG